MTSNQKRQSDYYCPVLASVKIDSSNALDLVKEYTKKQPIDLLILDIDGNDINVMESLLGGIFPRVVVVEFEKRFGPTACVRLKPEHISQDGLFLDADKKIHGSGSASIAAWISLFNKFNYRLIAASSSTINLFFMHNDEGADYFPEKKPSTIFDALPALKFVPDDYWLTPDNSCWEQYGE